MFAILKYNAAFPAAWRQATKGFTGQLNFMIAALLTRALREERSGKPEEIEESHASVTGANIDAANDALDEHSGREVNNALAEEQGHATEQPPLETAGYLKAIYNWVAAELEQHARRMVLPDGTKKADEFHLATPMENTLNFRATAPVRIDEAKVKAEAELYGVDAGLIRSNIEARAKRQQLAVIRDAERVLEMAAELRATGADGHELEAEACFDRLPAIYQVRVLAALDRAHYNAYVATVADVVSGVRKDAAGDAAHLNALRWEVRKQRVELLKDEKIKRDYEDALTRVSEPAWSPEPKMSLSPAANPAKKAA
jgi:hypothetical protein